MFEIHIRNSQSTVLIDGDHYRLSKRTEVCCSRCHFSELPKKRASIISAFNVWPREVCQSKDEDLLKRTSLWPSMVDRASCPRFEVDPSLYVAEVLAGEGLR